VRASGTELEEDRGELSFSFFDRKDMPRKDPRFFGLSRSLGRLRRLPDEGDLNRGCRFELEEDL